MSDELIKHLKEDNAAVRAECERLSALAKSRGAELKALRASATEAASRLAELEKQVTTAGKPDARVAELEKAIRDRDVSDAFREAASAAGLDPTRIEAARKLADWGDGTGEPKELATKAVEGLRASYDFLFTEVDEEFQPAARPVPQPVQHAPAPPPGKGRGAPITSPSGYSRADLQDPRKHAEIAASVMAGTYTARPN
jgi:hypothetical protein